MYGGTIAFGRSSGGFDSHRQAFEEAEFVAGLVVAGVAGNFVHKSSKEEHATAADAEFAGRQLGNGGDVEGLALIEEIEDDTVGADLNLDLHFRMGQIAMGVANNIGDRLAGGKDKGVKMSAFKAARLAHRFNEGACDGEHPWVARKGKREHRAIHRALRLFREADIHFGSIVIHGESRWAVNLAG